MAHPAKYASISTSQEQENCEAGCPGCPHQVARETITWHANLKDLAEARANAEGGFLAFLLVPLP